MRNHRARNTEAIRRNQGPPEDRNGAGPVQPPRYPPPPQYQQEPRREPIFDDYYGDNNYREPTMDELNAPDFRNQPWCIYEGSELENIAVDMSVVHNLPKFSGAHGESATTHLQRLHGICQNLKPNRVNIDDFKLKAFYFSLIDSANDWFLSLPSGSIRTWAQMQRKFLDKYYPAGRAMQVRRQLQDIKQGPNESMFDYLEKFNRLEQSCCNLGLPEKLIIEYMLDGLNHLDKMLLDASARGSLASLPLSGIRRLVTKFAENARFREETTRQDEFTQTKNVAKVETPVNSMTEQMEQMKEMMMQILQKQTVQIRPCEFCGSTEHKTDACPTLIEEDPVEANAVDGYQGYNNNNNHAGPSRQYGQATNPSRKNENHPPRMTQQAAPQPAQSFYQPPHQQYNQNAPPAGQYQQRGPNQYQHQGPGVYQNRPSNNQPGSSQPSTSRSLEDIMKELATGQLSQLTTAVSELKKESRRLPSQTVQNPRGNVNAVTLRSGKKLVIAPMEREEDESPELPEESEDAPEEEENAPEERMPGPIPATNPVPITETSKISASLPFPVPDRAPKQHVMDEDVFELFSKVKINIPLLEAIKQIPRYAKFLKELCTNRRRSARYDQELMSRNVSAVIQRKVPPKCGDPGTYTILCTIGNIRIENCMLDLGASINVLPFSIYSCLRIGPLEPTGLTIQLADRSCKLPEGKIEDVLVQVGKLVFPADFYVLKMENGGPTDHAPFLLVRPFLKTSKMKIDCGSGMLSMEVEGEVFSFDIFRAMKHPMEFEEVHTLDTLDDLVQEVQLEPRADPLEAILNGAEHSYELTEGLQETLAHLTISEPLTPGYEVNEVKLFKSNTFLPSMIQAPK
ncbi:unnamed protein product [Rhodiola kirilowii]